VKKKSYTPYKWTPEKLKYIEDNWQKMSDKEIALSVQQMLVTELGKRKAAKYNITPKAIVEQRMNLNLHRRQKAAEYTAQEIALIAKNWDKMSDHELLEKIKGMRVNPVERATLTVGAIRVKRGKLGYKRGKGSGKVVASQEAITHIREHYKERGNLWLSNDLNKLYPLAKEIGPWTPIRVWCVMNREKIKRTEQERKHVDRRQIELGIKQAKGGHKAAELNTIRTWRLGTKADGQPLKIVFVMTKDGWKRYKMWLWEKHNRPLNPGEEIRMKDGDEENVVLENLELVRHVDYMLKAQEEMTDNWIIGKLAKGNPELKELLKECPDVLQLYRNVRSKKQELQNL
jgi:hypothetical protein